MQTKYSIMSSKYNVFLARVIIVLAVVCIPWSSAWAKYSIDCTGMNDLSAVKEKVMQTVEESFEHRAIGKKEAIKRKMQIAGKFAEKFEEFKSRQRRLSHQIIQLTKYVQNRKNIRQLEKNKKQLVKEEKKRIESFIQNNEHIYIPLVYTTYIQLPIDREEKRSEVLLQKLLTQMIERHGITRIISSTQTANGELVMDTIKSKQLGMVEQDGIRSFDFKDLIHRSPQAETARYVITSFYRFKPFAQQSGQKKHADFDSQFNCTTKFWNLSEQKHLQDLKAFLRGRFGEDAAGDYIRKLEYYLDSLGNVSGKIKSAQERISYVLQKIERIRKEYRERRQIKDSRIERLQGMNREIREDLSLEADKKISWIENMIQRKKEEKKRLERQFEYTFILREEFYGQNMKTAFKHAIEEIFKSLDPMIEKRTMSIKTEVDMGNMQDMVKSTTKYEPSFTKVSIQKYIDQGKVGALLKLDVKYSQTKQPPSPEGGKESFVEDVKGLEIDMVRVKHRKEDQDFFISKQEIKKKQFVKFLQETEKTVSQLVQDNYCLQDEYPDAYTMTCHSQKGARAFANWLDRQSDRSYRLPRPGELRQASYQGIYSDTGFRIVSENPN